MINHVIMCLAILSILSSCAETDVTPTGSCGNSVKFDRSEKLSIHEVKLRSDVESPFFYLFEDQYIIKLSPVDVLSRLGENTSEGDSSVLRKLLNQRGPIRVNTDLKSFILEEPYLLRTLKIAAADLLDSGAASVVDINRGETGLALASILAVHAIGCGEQRYFCPLGGNLILYVMDSIC